MSRLDLGPTTQQGSASRRKAHPTGHTTVLGAAAAATHAPITLSQALTQKIRELCHRERWSQREFAERLGVTQGAVSYLLAEKRRASVLDYYERLAAIFGVSLSTLIADLEQHRVGTHQVEGAPHAASASAAHRGQHNDLFTDIVLLLLQHRLTVERAHTVPRFDVARTRFSELYNTLLQQGRAAAPPPRPKRRILKKERADPRRTEKRPDRVGLGEGDALPDGRTAVAADLQRTG